MFDRYNSEHFNTAGRSVKTGLISVDIQSHWTWSSTLLQSANQAFQYGVAGPYWYAGAAVVQILCFGIIAVYIKKRAPTSHTVLEIVHARWGTGARIVFLYFLLVTAIIVSGQLILGGSAVITSLTGMNIYAAIFIIPFTVVLYTSTGGLKATFTSSYIHTVIIFIVLLIFMFNTYTTNHLLGNIGVIYDHLAKVSALNPVSGNQGGSYLTFWSIDGLKFGILQAVSCWGITIVDQAYWQSAIAARPSAAYKGYVLGGLLWFGIPFGLATSLGLAVRALDLPLTVTEAGDGLVPPAAAIALLGKFGGILIVIIILMAITSSGSAEMVSVSSLITYDLYKPYIAKHASGKHLLWVSRLMVAFFGLVMACVSVIFYKANINLNFLYFLMATATCGAVPPLAASVTWNKTGKYAAIFSAFLGQGLGVAAWLVEAHIQYGVLNTTTLQQINPALTGGCFSLGTSLISTIILSYLWPQNFDWNEMRQISVFSDISKDKKSIAKEETKDALDNAEKKIWIWCIVLTFIFLFAWPLLALAPGGYFYFWVILSFIWGIVAAVLAFGLPIFESRFIIFRVLYSIFPCFPILERLGTQDLADPDSDTLGRRGSSSSQSSDSQDFQDAKLNMRTPADLQHANSAQPLTANLVPPHKVSPPS
ncbi:hypothetical protein WJX74_005599 [Apatococcus lobatus]|uniref:Uncharacterized protein n=1 Tax=Apatococcus lobatus TaxID=904363 RepID=A0AAW1RML5_9CHLO